MTTENTGPTDAEVEAMAAPHDKRAEAYRTEATRVRQDQGDCNEYRRALRRARAHEKVARELRATKTRGTP